MKTMTTIAVAWLALAGTAPAYAQEAKFEGPWIGAVGGYDMLGIDDGSDSGSEGDVLYGVAAGYDFNLGGVRVGFEIEATKSGVGVSTNDLIVAGDSLSIKAGRDLFAGARIGMPLAKNVMGFVKAGYSNARIKSTYHAGTTTDSYAANDGGYRVGGGVEIDLGLPFARIEYRYSNYGDFDGSGINTDRHQVALTAGIRF